MKQIHFASHFRCHRLMRDMKRKSLRKFSLTVLHINRTLTNCGGYETLMLETLMLLWQLSHSDPGQFWQTLSFGTNFQCRLGEACQGCKLCYEDDSDAGGDKGLGAGWMMEAVGSVVNPLMPLNHVRVPVCLLRDEFIVKAKPYFSASTTTPGGATGTPSTTLPPWTLQTSCRDSSRMRQCMSQCERGSAGTVGGHSHYWNPLSLQDN